MDKHEKEQVPSYEPPSVIDYGTLTDITRASTFANSDTPAGDPDTAFPVAS